MLINRLEKYGLGGECKRNRSGVQSKQKPWVNSVVDKGGKGSGNCNSGFAWDKDFTGRVVVENGY